MPNNPQNAKTFFIFSLFSFYETEPFPIASETFFLPRKSPPFLLIS
jgi:hypothetical protein